MSMRILLLFFSIALMGFSCGSSKTLEVTAESPSELSKTLDAWVLENGFYKIDCNEYWTKDLLPFTCYRYGNNSKVVPLFTIYIKSMESALGSEAVLFDSQGANPDADTIFKNIVEIATKIYGEERVSIKK